MWRDRRAAACGEQRSSIVSCFGHLYCDGVCVLLWCDVHTVKLADFKGTI